MKRKRIMKNAKTKIEKTKIAKSKKSKSKNAKTKIVKSKIAKSKIAKTKIDITKTTTFIVNDDVEKIDEKTRQNMIDILIEKLKISNKNKTRALSCNLRSKLRKLKHCGALRNRTYYDKNTKLKHFVI